MIPLSPGVGRRPSRSSDDSRSTAVAVPVILGSGRLGPPRRMESWRPSTFVSGVAPCVPCYLSATVMLLKVEGSTVRSRFPPWPTVAKDKGLQLHAGATPAFDRRGFRPFPRRDADRAGPFACSRRESTTADARSARRVLRVRSGPS